MKTSAHALCLGAALMAAVPDTHGKLIEVQSPIELTQAAASAEPGDEIVIQDGVWKDTEIRISPVGAKGNPIVIRPETPGGLTLTGVSRFRIGGAHCIVSGILFKNIRDQSDWFALRYDSKKPAHHCRVTDCAFIEDEDFDPGSKESRWLGVYGDHNEVDHCRFEGKKTKGATAVVWITEGAVSSHRLHHNLWYRRERLGKNGGESLRVGDSKTSLLTAQCLIEDNVFQHCNGEIECISNKSCENTYRSNLFLETLGTLTLRHGHRCLVEKNLFLGNGLKHTGGIRIIGEAHVIRDNDLWELGGTDARGAIVLQNGIPNTPLNGYSPVKKAIIENNRIIECRECMVIGYQDEDSDDAVAAPASCLIQSNLLVAASDHPVIHAIHRPDSFSWKANQAVGETLGIPPTKGLKWHRPESSEVQLPSAPRLDGWSKVGPSWMPQGPIQTK